MGNEKYYIGIDAGTNSVGWAVTTPDYELVKKHGKTLWGARLFDEAATAEKRRMARSARRGRDRQAYRQALLRELFSEEITKVDPAFYLRLDESKFFEEDKKVTSRYCLFADRNYTDRDYHASYPTIYHLRRELMESKQPHDVRLVYLAVAHIIKHRGHFLSDMSTTDKQPDIQVTWDEFVENMQELMSMEVNCKDMDEFKRTLQEKMPKNEKKKKLKQLITVTVPEEAAPFTCIYDLLSGSNCDVSKSFGVQLEGEEKNALKLSFAGEDMNDEEKLSVYQNHLGEKLQILLDLKSIYDWGVLVGILHGADSLSEARVQSYNQHASDLKKLQNVIRAEAADRYNEMFRQVKKNLNNYCAYTGHYDTKNPQYKAAAFRCTQEDFYKYVKSVLKGATSQQATEILNAIELGTFLPLQHTKENSVVPYQMHLRELRAILDNASAYLPFLLETDEQGISVREKVESLLTYRVPYYVGPLDNTNAKPGTHWAVKKHPEQRVYPWNFDEVVDKEASAQAFMEQLTNTCTYLIGESVMPKDSIAYSRYMALNELNNVRIYGEKLPVSVKQRAFDALFLRKNQVTRKNFNQFLMQEGLLKKGEEEAVSGIDGDFKASLKTELKLRSIFGEQLPGVADMDAMIRAVLVLKQEPDMLRNRIRNICPSITDDQLKQVCKLSCSGWGRFSEKFLTQMRGIMPEVRSEPMSILDALWNTQYNLMELLAADKPYSTLIEENNREIMGETKLDYKALDDVDAPPYVRRTVWQTLRIVKEIIQIMGCQPEKIFVEMARGKDGSGRTVSRKNKLMACYEAMGEDGQYWINAIDKYDDARLRQDKLYLYFTQLGRCMYTGAPIDLSALLNDTGSQIYDIDHIYPQSKVKDDSLDNRVLVQKQQNQDKTDKYPIAENIRKNRSAYWEMLHQKGLISKTKLERLKRATPFTDDELAGFISRQLVETQQSTKILARILEQALPNSRVVYVKARNVTEFRRAYDLIKVRDLNDYHHAKDAYLNIVVGNVYDVKFTTNPKRFICSGEPYSMKTEVLFKRRIQRGNTVAWRGEEHLSLVKKMYRKNNIMITRQAEQRNSGQNGGLYDNNPVSDGKIPLNGDARLANTERYGGYNGDTGAYMFLVEHRKGKKRVRSLEPMYLRFAKRAEEDSAYLQNYCVEVLGLTEPKVIIPKIRFNTLLEIKGFPIYLTGRSGDSLLGVQAFQMVLSETQEQYLKKVLKACDRLKKAKTEIEITEANDGVTSAENLALYDLFLAKMQLPVYATRPGSQIGTLQKGRDLFVALSLVEQCQTLANILGLFRKNGETNLTSIGGSSTAGKLQPTRTLHDSAKLIYTSVTGFYRQEVDLLSE